MTAIEDARAALARHESQNAYDPFHYPLTDHRYVALRALITEYERLTTPPTDAEREALATVIESARLPMGGTLLGSRPQFIAVADAILASDVWRNRRQGPITDARLRAARIAYASVYETGVRHKEALRAALEAARDTP